MNIKEKFEFYKNNPEALNLLTLRNFQACAAIRMWGLHGFKTIDVSKYLKNELYSLCLLNGKIDIDKLVNRLKELNFEYFSNELYSLCLLIEKLNYFVFDKISIPQIEFTLTTKCTLKCKNCTNYIPKIKGNEHSQISIEEFKLYLKNLSKSVHKIYNLLLLGGEPLTIKNLEEYVDEAAKNKKVENVWIVTNGTLLISNNLLKIIKKHNKKVTIWISNYSGNEDLVSRLKHKELFEQIKQAGANLIFQKDSYWLYVNENIENYNRTETENRNYFRNCMHRCMAVFGNKGFICPRSGTFYLKNLYVPKENETFNLNAPPKELKQQLISFYSNDYFQSCNFCSILEDNTKPYIIPAIQQ